MPLEITKLDELAPEKVEAIFATFTQLMQERHPDVELTRGAFHDLVLYFNSVLAAAVRENIDLVLQSNSLWQIIKNPALAEVELVDRVLSNYNVVRDSGTEATGLVTIVVNLPVLTNIAAGVILSADDIEFVTTNAFVLIPPTAQPRDDNDKKLVVVGDGTYAANITVQAVAVGASGNIPRGTKLIPNFAQNNVLELFAASDFIAGRDASTNEEYLQKLATGLAAKTIGGRKSYEALIRAQSKFENMLHCSVLGCGDPEQQRDQHGLFPISGGGKVDVYVQTNFTGQEVTNFLPAKYIGPGDVGSVWQVNLDRESTPGFYDIVRVTTPSKDDEAHKILMEDRGANLIDVAYVPDIKYLHESAYTRYQYAIIQFEDETTLPTAENNLIPNVTTAQYAVTTRSMPLVAEIHDFLTSRDTRARGTDILVKAAVPCFTRISFTIQTEANEPVLDSTIAEIKLAIVKAVGGIGFGGQLHSSIISGAAHKYLSGRQAIREIDMFGKIHRPDGTVAYLRDNTLLTIPNDPQRLVTGRTTAFLVGVADIAITTATAGFTD